MAVVQGVKERVHLPVYDSVTVEPEEQLGKILTSSTLKFFVDVQSKTKLETNLQAAALLPHYNTFEARAMRVVISDLPPEFPDDVDATVTGTPVTPELETDLKRLMELLDEARADETNHQTTVRVDSTSHEEVESGGVQVTLTVDDLESALDDLGDDAPPPEQISPDNGAGTLIGKVIYNTVTTLFVGEKVMIQMPTWFFPSGAGVFSEQSKFSTHGEPNPTATFRFAEPIFIDRQQNFRVEIEIPDSNVFSDLKKIYGPFFLWVVLDGYMTRDVQ